MLFDINTNILFLIVKYILAVGCIVAFIYIVVVAFFMIILGICLHYVCFPRREGVFGVIDSGNLNNFTIYKMFATLFLIINIIWFLIYSKNTDSKFLIEAGLVINLVFLILVNQMFSYYKKIVKPLIFHVPIREKQKSEYKNMVMKWRIKMNSAIGIILLFQLFVVFILLVNLTTDYSKNLNSILKSSASYFSITTLSGIFAYAGIYLIQDLDYIYWTFFEEDYKKWMEIIL